MLTSGCHEVAMPEHAWGGIRVMGAFSLRNDFSVATKKNRVTVRRLNREFGELGSLPG